MIGSWEVPASWFLSFPAICVILLSPVFGWIWLKLGAARAFDAGEARLGLVFGAIGFVVMALAAIGTRGGTVKVAPWWLLTTYFIHTVGELCLSPVGLSASPSSLRVGWWDSSWEPSSWATRSAT